MEGGRAPVSVFGPVHPPTTFEETVERLGTAIRLGLLAPGSQLPPERELAEQLGIARSTLRQALTTLGQSGHLVAQRGRGGGTFVAAAPPLAGGDGRLRDDWREVLDARVAFECGVALLAAERLDDEAAAGLEALIARMDEASEFEDYRRADVRFHIAIAEATGTPRLVASATELQGEVSELIMLIAHPPVVLRHANDEHRRLLRCLRAHDGPGTVKVMRAHLAGTEHIIAGLAPA
jgi:DNA-binding FadR family transcriptional regulator